MTAEKIARTVQLRYNRADMKTDAIARPHANRFSRSWKLRLLFATSLIWAAPALACGSFAPRPTPTPTLPPIETNVAPATEATPLIDFNATPAAVAAVETPTPEATATFTPTPVPGTALSIGQPARVVAPNGLNMRAEASTEADLVRYLPAKLKVTIVDGPTSADGYTWWKLDDGEGNIGWAVDNDGETELLSPRLGEPEPVDRAPRVGDRVVVTMSSGGQLSVRLTPGTDAELVTRVNIGDQFTVTGGPQQASGYTWYQIRSDDGSVEGWAADGDASERWLSPLE
ncbi:MAG: SH3 domain-containing protein [Caldilineaceae bacterium]|nr:SH3 domain-containing protein [Caldilineaceae bacterium]